MIHLGVLALWAALFAAAFLVDGPFAWAAGIVYVGYDTGLVLFVAWQTRDLLRPSPPPQPAPGGRRPTLAIIVAAHDEAAVLPATLAALLAQTDPAERIVIADDGSRDATAAMLEQAYGLTPPLPGSLSQPSSRHPSLVWLRLPHGGKAPALNAAIMRIDTDIVLTVDADTLLDRGAVAAMRAAFAAEPELVAATGVLDPVCSASPGAWLLQRFQTYEYVRNMLSRHAWMRQDSLLLISGAFAGFRRDAVIAVGGFDPHCLVEDYELIHRLRRHAVDTSLVWRTRVLGQALARTDAPAGIAAFLRQRRRWFGGFLETQYWYRAMAGDARHGRLGTLMLPVKAFDTLQPIHGLTAFAVLAYGLASGRVDLVGLAAGVMGAKLALDLAFHLWSVHLYRRWTGLRGTTHFGAATLAALAEPFTFQLLRHCGAAWGWLTFLSGRRDWGRRRRHAVAPSPFEPQGPQAGAGAPN